MRVVLAIAVGLACPSAVAAQAAGDRYGPPSAARLNAAAAAAWRGPTLSWSNKQAQASAQAALPQAPAPYRATPTYAPFQPQVPLPLRQPVATPPAARDLPTSLYSQATPAAAPAPAAPQRLAAAPAAARTVGGTPRLYSVHRGYGLTPDAIPAQPAGERYVLVGPPDAPKARDEADDASPAAF